VKSHFNSYEQARNASLALRDVVEQLKQSNQNPCYTCTCMLKRSSHESPTTSARKNNTELSPWNDLSPDTSIGVDCNQSTSDAAPKMMHTGPAGTFYNEDSGQPATEASLETRLSSAMDDLTRYDSETTKLALALDMDYDYRPCNCISQDHVTCAYGSTYNVTDDVYRAGD
jgi:hypothetical protein